VRFNLTRLLAAASLSALSAVSAPAAEPIHVGFFSHLSGNFAEYGASSKNGVELYPDAVNAQGGIEGRCVYRKPYLS
jgi:branched-chain amino acid transport system substrate-binding protein